MVDYIKEIFKIKTTVVLLIISLFSIFLSVFRTAFSGQIMFLFMLWNLFLAFIPWFIASIIYIKEIKNKFSFIMLIICWLAFFPNAPYILTDIIHLGKGHPVPIWFDLILLLSYGFTGLLYGFSSLYMIEKNIEYNFKINKSWILSVLMIYISCFGIYLGRFLRWNSWDILINLDEILRDIYIRMLKPFEYQTTWAFTILFGTLLNILFWSYKVFSEDNHLLKSDKNNSTNSGE